MTTTTAFCAICQRTVYLSDGEQLSCPVCASPLVLSEAEVRRMQRIALNEDAFRKVNEAIRRAAEGVPSEEPIDFVCECGNKECKETITVSPSHYQVARKDPACFIILPAHAISDAEEVIKKRDNHWIVKKTGFAKELAEELDNR